MTSALQHLFRNRLAAVGFIILSLLLVIILLTPLLPLVDPAATDTAHKFLRPFQGDHLMGTDHLGRDLLSRLLFGTRLSLAVGFSAALLAALIGSGFGIVAGYYRGRTDNIIMRGVDMLMAFPYILLSLAIVAALGPGLMNALIAVAAVNIPFFARNIRGITVGLSNKEFVDAARLGGKSHLLIIITEILPNVLPVIVIAMSTTIGWMILETAGLSFLGLGSQPPQADLGSMLGEARNALITDPHASIIPGLMIFLIVMSINLVGDGVRDALDPRLRSGALTSPQAATRIDRTVIPDPALETLLEVRALETQFHIGERNYRAVNQVDLAIGAGECLGLIGESGSGKSVTALSIMGLVASPPGVVTGGAIYVNGEEVMTAPYKRLRELRGGSVAYIFQDPLGTLHPLYTVVDQLVEAIQAHRKCSTLEARNRSIELLNKVRIPNAEERADVYPHELSGGMRQRVAIAMALANEPKLIIADEPTTALDVTVQAQILVLLDDLRKQNDLSILFITHDFGVIAQMCDRVAVMYAGRIVESGPVEDLLERPAHPYTRRLMACVPELGGGRRTLASIPGLPPVVDNLPEGCSFAPRCDKATEACRQGEIVWSLGNSRGVRCLHPEAKIR
jgi:peptide/nickel transport system permease protein